VTASRFTLPLGFTLAARPKDTVPVLHEPRVVATSFAWGFAPGRRSRVILVKATASLGTDAPHAPLVEPEPLSGDEPLEEAGSLRRASDFAPFKPRVDVTLVGHGHPTMAGGALGRVALRVGALRSEVLLAGDRTWEGGEPSAPLPFVRMPLVWERAYGGVGFDANPLGRGFGGLVLPNLERPGAELRRAKDVAQPRCFAPVPREWTSRRTGLGTYDASWLAERWPYLAGDVDWSVFNHAPRELQLESARGDERYEVEGVLPGGRTLEGRLPAVRPRVLALASRDAVTTLTEVPLVLDTLAFDGDAQTVSLVWRGRIDVSAEAAPELDRFVVLVRPLDDPASVAELVADVTERLVESEGPNVLVANDAASADEPPLLPEPAPPRVSSELALAAVSAEAVLAGADLSGFDLRMAPLAGRDLRGANLSDAHLDGADLSGAQLEGAVLTRAYAPGVNFAGANLTGANLAEASLRSCDFSGATLDHALLADSDLREARFDGSTLARTRFDEARLERATFAKARAEGVILSGAWLEGAVFSEALLDDAQLYDARAVGAVFERARLVRARFDGATLTGATLTGVGATGASLEGCHLARARLDGATLDEAVLAHANLAGACLDRVSAKGARFRGTDWTGALAREANLAEASLEAAVLTNADLRGSNLYGVETLDAVLGGVNLEGARVANTKLAPR
jgi:uncharacterized protein YjbI with pentapeptide repeats